jgi:hypothetical protein
MVVAFGVAVGLDASEALGNGVPRVTFDFEQGIVGIVNAGNQRAGIRAV